MILDPCAPEKPGVPEWTKRPSESGAATAVFFGATFFTAFFGAAFLPEPNSIATPSWFTAPAAPTRSAPARAYGHTGAGWLYSAGCAYCTGWTTAGAGAICTVIPGV